MKNKFQKLIVETNCQKTYKKVPFGVLILVIFFLQIAKIGKIISPIKKALRLLFFMIIKLS